MTIQPALDPEALRRDGVSQASVGRTLGTFEFDDDEDYFLFNPLENRVYTIRVDSPADTILGVFATPSLLRLARDDDSGPGIGPEIVFETGAGPQVILIEVDTAGSREPGGNGPPGPIASYALEIRDRGPAGVPPPPGIDRVGDTRETGGGIRAGEVVFGTIEEPFDVDAFSIWLEAGRLYRVTLSGLEGFDPFLEIAAPDGRTLVAEDGGGANGIDAQGLFRPAESDFYTIGASGSDLAFDTGDYALRVEDLGALLSEGTPDLAPDGVGPAGVPGIEIGRTVAGRIDGAVDLDLYAVFLEAGAAYAFGVIGYGGFDPRLTLLDGTQRVLAGDDNGLDGTGAFLRFTPAFSDFYILEVAASFAAPFSGNGDFDLFTEQRAAARAFPSEVRDIARIYEAGLDRLADEPGLNFWVDVFEDTGSLRFIANAFLVSREFRETIGEVGVISDFALVTGLYENVLDRPADDPGRNFWLSVLARPEVDEADLLIAFARSGENEANTPEVEDIRLVADGVWGFG